MLSDKIFREHKITLPLAANDVKPSLILIAGILRQYSDALSRCIIAVFAFESPQISNIPLKMNLIGKSFVKKKAACPSKLPLTPHSRIIK